MKRCGFFSTQALFSRFMNFKKKENNFVPFFLEIAQNFSTYKEVSYKNNTECISICQFQLKSDKFNDEEYL